MDLAYLECVSRTKINWNECQPDDTRCVHRETDKLGFVKILRNLHGERERSRKRKRERESDRR